MLSETHGPGCLNQLGQARCNFESKYDTTAPDERLVELLLDRLDDLPMGTIASDVKGMIDVLKARTYVCDVCKACGKSVPRIDPPSKTTR